MHSQMAYRGMVKSYTAGRVIFKGREYVEQRN
jgi:hypothetical protein